MPLAGLPKTRLNALWIGRLWLNVMLSPSPPVLCDTLFRLPGANRPPESPLRAREPCSPKRRIVLRLTSAIRTEVMTCVSMRTSLRSVSAPSFASCAACVARRCAIRFGNWPDRPLP